MKPSSKTVTSLCLLAALFLNDAGELRADSWIYPSEARVFTSANGEYRFKVAAPKNDAERSQHHSGDSCLGTLERHENDSFVKIWQRHLVNPVSPLDAIITDDGKSVVTFDNWFGVGTDPIVIYNNKGDLVKRHTLETLGLKAFTEDSTGDPEPPIKRSMSSVWWNDDALIFLNERQDALVVRMYWGYLFAVRLTDGSLLSAHDLANQAGFIGGEVKRRCNRLMASNKPEERREGAVIAGTAGFKELIARLKELLADPAWNAGYSSDGYRYTGSYREYYVREAALKALRAMGIDVGGVETRDDFFSAEDEARVKATTHPQTTKN